MSNIKTKTHDDNTNPFPVRQTIPRRRVAISDTLPSMAKQSFKAECDINNIMKAYQRTGAISHFATHEPQYAYCPSEDFREALEIVQQGRELFAALPSSIRTRFGNDPAEFLAFVQDDRNADEARALGLCKASEAPPLSPPGVAEDKPA